MDEHVRDEVVQLVLTSPGERAFLPEFGGGVRRLVFEATGDATAAVAKARLSQALSSWLGSRLTVDEIRVASADATLDLTIRYHLAGSDDARLLQFQHRQGG
jgi:phage baseplate assembly protein W